MMQFANRSIVLRRGQQRACALRLGRAQSRLRAILAPVEAERPAGRVSRVAHRHRPRPRPSHLKLKLSLGRLMDLSARRMVSPTRSLAVDVLFLELLEG